MIVYCNDNTQRICRIRGALGKRSWIEKGDIVLISVRDNLASGINVVANADISNERGDILEKYDSSVLGKLKKEDGMNPKLFLSLETMEDGKIRAGLENLDDDGQEDFFEHEVEEEVDKPKIEEEIDIDNI